LVRQGAGVAVAGDLSVDDVRVELADDFVAEADLDDAGAEVLDHDVGLLEELADLREVFGIFLFRRERLADGRKLSI